jgi:hypothetical protein
VMKKIALSGLLASSLLMSPATAQLKFGKDGKTGTIIFTPLANNAMPLSYQLDNSLSIDVTGGTRGSVSAAGHNLITLYGAPDSNFWTALDGLTFSGSGGSGEHVAHYDQTLRYGTGPSLWAAIAEMTDFTGKPSSQTGANLTYEMDLNGHQLDDAEKRTILSGVINPAADNNGFFEASNGYTLTVDPGAYARTMYRGGGAYTNAAIDLRYAAPFNLGATSLSGVTFPTTTAAVKNSVTVPVSNVMPFTSDTWGRELNGVQGGSQARVYIGGVAYTQVGYAVTGTGPTPAGTITLSGPVTLAPNMQVANSSGAIWLSAGQPINLDAVGATSITSDGSTVTVNGKLAAAMAGGASCAATQINPSTMTVVNGVITHC